MEVTGQCIIYYFFFSKVAHSEKHTDYFSPVLFVLWHDIFCPLNLILCKAIAFWHFFVQNGVWLYRFGSLPLVLHVTSYCCISVKWLLRCRLWENEMETIVMLLSCCIYLFEFCCLKSSKLKQSIHEFWNGFQMWILALKLVRVLCFSHQVCPSLAPEHCVFSRLQQALLSGYWSFCPNSVHITQPVTV